MPATNENLLTLSELTEHYAEPEVAIHFHIYLDDYVLIDWYDAFDDPMYVSKYFSEEEIKEFCDKVSMTYKDHRSNVERCPLTRWAKNAPTGYGQRSVQGRVNHEFEPV